MGRGVEETENRIELFNKLKLLKTVDYGKLKVA